MNPDYGVIASMMPFHSPTRQAQYRIKQPFMKNTTAKRQPVIDQLRAWRYQRAGDAFTRRLAHQQRLYCRHCASISCVTAKDRQYWRHSVLAAAAAPVFGIASTGSIAKAKKKYRRMTQSLLSYAALYMHFMLAARRTPICPKMLSKMSVKILAACRG